HDATEYPANHVKCPTIAYSGEIDPQKQSADVMEKAMAAEGLKLERFIGPQTAHQYEPETRKKLAERLEELMAVGRFRLSNEVHLTTYTLHYPWADWIQILGMEHQWERADVRAVV